MKRIFLLSLCVLCCLATYSQETFFSIGFNNSLINTTKLSGIIDRFNDYNTWQYMEPYRNLSGLVAEVNIRDDQGMGSIGWCGRHKNLKGEGYDSNNVARETFLKHRYNYFYVNYIWHFVNTDHFKMGPGLSGGVGTYKIMRKDQINNVEEEFEDIIRKHQFIGSVMFNVSIYLGDHVSINFQPYIQAPLLNGAAVELFYLDNQMNPTYKPRLSEDELTEWPYGTGFYLTLSFGG